MKKYNIATVLVVVLGLFIGGCSLDEYPEYSQNSKTMYADQASAETILMQCYGHLASEEIYGQKFNELTCANGVTWAKTDGGFRQRFVTYDAYAEDDTYLGGVWRGFYKVIAESNYFMDGLNRSDLPEEYKKRGLAHAHFLRGFSYFMLANLYGKAIIILDPISVDNLHSPINKREEVYAQAESDLIFASENLNEEEAMDGLAVKNTAIAYLAKFYFIRASQLQAEGQNASELWKKAKNYGDKLIGKYSLEPNYANLWKSHLNNSPEVIFQLNYSSDVGVRNRSNFNFGPVGGRNTFAKSGAPSWGNYRFDKAFFDFHRGTHPGDPRINVTYLTKWISPKNNQEQYVYPYFKAGQTVYYMDNLKNAGSDPKNPDYDFTAYDEAVKNYWDNDKHWDKGMNPYNAKMADVNTSANQYDTKNIVIFRYADLLLLMADVENELGNINKAVDYVNQVLARARQSGASTTSPADISAALGQDGLREFIFFERMIELAGEPVLFEDIRRRGTSFLKKVMEIHNNSHIVNYRYKIETDNKVGNAFREYMINGKNLTDNFLKKNLMLPIPASEINYNENITQADQNFGY